MLFITYDYDKGTLTWEKLIERLARIAESEIFSLAYNAFLSIPLLNIVSFSEKPSSLKDKKNNNKKDKEKEDHEECKDCKRKHPKN